MRSPVTSVAVRGGRYRRPCPDNRQERRDSQVTGITTVTVSPTYSSNSCRGPGLAPGQGGRPWPCLRGQSAAANPARRGRRLLGKSVTDGNQGLRSPGKEAFVRYVVTSRAGHDRCRAERTFWAYPVSCVSACDRTAIPLSVANRLALFQGCGVRDNWILSVLPAGDCGAGVVLLTGDGHSAAVRFHLPRGRRAFAAASGLGELRNVAEVAGLRRLEEDD